MVLSTAVVSCWAVTRKWKNPVNDTADDKVDFLTIYDVQIERGQSTNNNCVRVDWWERISISK